MADIWGECERGEKGMMRDPDEPLPQKQGLISTSHPIKVSLYHFITQPRNLKSVSVRNFVKMKRSVWQEHCNRIYSIRIAQVLWFGGRALFVVTTKMIKSCSTGEQLEPKRLTLIYRTIIAVFLQRMRDRYVLWLMLGRGRLAGQRTGEFCV